MLSIGYGERSTAPLSPNCSVLETDNFQAEPFQRAVYGVTLPLLVAFGMVANLLDLIVLSTPAMKGVSYRYLARLAVCDSLYLLFNIPFCFMDFSKVTLGKTVTRMSAIFYAHLAIPLVNVFLTLGIYIVVWLSYDRFLAVCFPHKFTSKQRLHVVHSRFAISFLITLLVYMPTPIRQQYTCEDDRGCCVHDSQYLDSAWYVCYEFFRELYSRFLPAILITTFNVAIIVTLRHMKKNRGAHSDTPDVISDARHERERKLMILLLAMTAQFYVTTFPSAVYKVIFQKNLTFLPYFRAVADVLEVSGHVFNFVLYFLLSPEFRKTLLTFPRHRQPVAITSSIVQQ